MSGGMGGGMMRDPGSGAVAAPSSSGAVTDKKSSDRASQDRTSESVVRRLLGAGTAIVAKFTRGIRVSAPAASAVDLATFDASATANAQVVHIDKDGHLAISQAALPTIAAQAGAGVGATAAINGTDQSGRLAIITGTGVGAGNAFLAQVTFATAYATAPTAVFFGHTDVINLNAHNLIRSQDIAHGTVTTTTFNIIGGAAALAASTVYYWDYWVI